MKMSILDPCNYRCRVSSVLNRDVKSYGKNHLFDGKEDTCWNSDQGSPQWIYIDFLDPVEVTAFCIQFQGGFVGMNCVLEFKEDEHSVAGTEEFYPEDINSQQTFALKMPRTIKHVKFVFNKSTDFFGRIVVYKFDIIGNKK